MRDKALMVFAAMLAGFAVLPAWSAKTNQSGADSSFHMGGPSGWLTTDSGQHYRFVSMGISTQPHIFQIGGHNASEVKSITWKDCCNVDAVLRDGTSEVVNTLQLKDVYMVDGATVMMSYGIDGLPVTVISPATDARKVMRFPNLQGIKSIRFDPIGSTQHLAAAGKHRGVNAGSFSGQRGSDAMSQAPANVEYFAAHQGEIRKVTSERERQDIANGDTRGAAALESSYQAALAATNQYLATKSAAAKAESTDPCWSTKLTLAQIAYGMANWSATDAAGYAAFRSRAMAIAGAYVPATVSYVRQLLEGANESEQHAAEIFLALDSAAKSSDVPANSAADALELQGEAMGHVHGCSPRP